MSSAAELDAQLGERVSMDPSPWPSENIQLVGNTVTFTGLKEEHIADLYKNFGLPDRQEVFAFISIAAPNSPAAFGQALNDLREHGFVLYAILADSARLAPKGSKTRHSEVLGMIAYLDIQQAHRGIEIGAVMYSPILQRTAAATEVNYLMLRHAFGEGEQGLSPPYRRVVWKCNNLNTGSRRAAERLGFVYEGTFRKHMISKGRSRDSDWLSIVDDEWPVVKAGLEAWLREDNFEKGKQKRKLEDLREEASKAVTGAVKP